MEKLYLKLKSSFRQMIRPEQEKVVRQTLWILRRMVAPPFNLYGRLIKTPYNLWVNKGKTERRLEIGPGPRRIENFETVNVVWGVSVDYVVDASKKLPFSDDEFSLVYASHVLEHIPWYKAEKTFAEWARIVRPNGFLEVWVPNGLLIAKTFVEAEEGRKNNIDLDGWYKFNDQKDSCVWANGRIFSYGDGSGRKVDPNWHMALFSPRYLENLFVNHGFIDVEVLDKSEVRGHDHGWINLGVRGRKL